MWNTLRVLAIPILVMKPRTRDNENAGCHCEYIASSIQMLATFEHPTGITHVGVTKFSNSVIKQLRKGTEQVYPLLVLELKGR